jgi:hypothetical protein
MWKKRVSLKDVQDATPAESQEESRVMQSIERNDPTGTSSRHFDQATAIPLELTTEEEQQTVEDELLACTASINKLQSSSSGGPAPAEIFRGNSRNAANTQADAFAANAGQLFHRFQKRRPKPMDVETGSGKSRTKRKSKNPNLESLNDFRDLVVSNKDYTCTYIRNSLLFLILPSTGIACL